MDNYVAASDEIVSKYVKEQGKANDGTNINTVGTHQKGSANRVEVHSNPSTTTSNSNNSSTQNSSSGSSISNSSSSNNGGGLNIDLEPVEEQLGPEDYNIRSTGLHLKQQQDDDEK